MYIIDYFFVNKKRTTWIGINSLIIFCMVSHLAFAQKKDIQLANEYYAQRDFDKAKTIYETLAKDLKNIPLIHNNYFFVLVETLDFLKAKKYVNRLMKKFPNNMYYPLDFGLIYWKQGNRDLADSWFIDIVENIKQNSYKTRIVAEYFISKQLMSYAVHTYQQSRESISNPYVYALELANIYRTTGKKEWMMEEYLNYVTQSPSDINYVKNVLQNLVLKEEDLEGLETVLYKKIQNQPDNIVYSELLIWVFLQQKDFYAAFVQARALDKRQKTQGQRSNRIGLISLENRNFDLAITIFSYVIKEYPNSVNYIRAKMNLIKTHQEQIKEKYPVDEVQVRNLVFDYQEFIEEMGNNENALEASRNKALLHAFYLDEKRVAIQILENILKVPEASHLVKSKSKMDLGDIHLLVNEPWKSVLYYAQVEKSNKDTRIGYEAKLKNAKLSYYKGDFALAQEHLDILKQATTREIANDAMQLSVLIKDNIALDSTTLAMKEYAAIDLLLFQNKTSEVLASIKAFKEKYATHSLIDDLLWLEANVNIDIGLFEYAATLLENISTNHVYDIWSDDAYFKLGNLYEKQIGDLEKAKEIYYDFMTQYPGSVYVAEARKRFRNLRGDFKPKETPVLK